MKVLLVAATHAELSGVFEHYQLANQPFSSTPSFDLLITGVGMTATAFSLGRHLKQEYNLVINLGIAGSFDRSLPLGTIVAVTQDCFAELGAEDHDDFLPIDQLGFGQSVFKADFYHLIPQRNAFQKVTAITVNKVHGHRQSIASVNQRLSPAIESMEGAAVFYCCAQLNIPVVQLRSISNYVEPRNKDSWEIGLAIKNLNDWVIGFLTNV